MTGIGYQEAMRSTTFFLTAMTLDPQHVVPRLLGMVIATEVIGTHSIAILINTITLAWLKNVGVFMAVGGYTAWNSHAIVYLKFN